MTDARNRDKALQGPDYFDAARHPELIFESSRVRAIDTGRLEVTGLLTMRGTTRPLTVVVRHSGTAAVPASYLRGFVDPDTPAGQEPYVWIADFERNKVRRKAPENAAALTNYYAAKGESGDLDHEAERTLGRFESAAIPVLRQIVAGSEDWTTILSAR